MGRTGSLSIARDYALLGWNGESRGEAEERLERILDFGFLPFAQLYQGPAKNDWALQWKRFQRKPVVSPVEPWTVVCRDKLGKVKLRLLVGDVFSNIQHPTK